MKIIFTIYLVLFYSIIIVNGQLKFDKIFSDNMVLQRDKPIKIWGIAKPGSIIQVSKGNQKKITKTKSDATWFVIFNAEKANTSPQAIKAKTNADAISINNILIVIASLIIGLIAFKEKLNLLSRRFISPPPLNLPRMSMPVRIPPL